MITPDEAREMAHEGDDMSGWREAISDLSQQVEDLQKDAARYRWLRDVGDSTWRPFCQRAGYSSEQCDKAIDEAMK